MSGLVITPRAREDLLDIWDFIARDSLSMADAFIEKIHGKLVTLAISPNIGRPRDNLGDGVRSFPLGRYVIFYRSLPGQTTIIRVLHSSRDIPTVF